MALSVADEIAMRWLPRHKLVVVSLWKHGKIKQVKKMMVEHDISMEELEDWLSSYEAFGLDGLRVRS